MMGVGDVAAILTAAGVTVYVLGLIGLAIPIRRVFTEDISTAWYAVALVPKTVVAGQGVIIWLRWPVVISALLLCATALQAISTTASVTLVAWIVCGYGLYVGWAQQISSHETGKILGSELLGILYKTTMEMTRYFLRALIATIGSMVAFFGFVHLNAEIAAMHPFFLAFARDFFPSGNPFIVGMLLVLIGSFLMGLLPAIAAAPPLPKVKIVKQGEGDRHVVPGPLEGYLVAHSDGFWHFFNEHNELLSIPDDQVSSVRVSGTTEKMLGRFQNAPPWWIVVPYMVAILLFSALFAYGL